MRVGINRERAHGGLQPKRMHPLQLRNKPVDEAGEIWPRRMRPADLRDGDRPRESVPLCALFGADMLGPEIALESEDMALLRLRQLRRSGIERIDGFERDEIAAPRRLERAERLAIVELESRRWAQD